MKYYIVIGHKEGETVDGKRCETDWIELIERDDPYSDNDNPPGAHRLFGYLDYNFGESAQYGTWASKSQEAWLIGRHRITKEIGFGNCSYQFIRWSTTKRIQYPGKITLSFDKKIRDNGVERPMNDDNRIDIELFDLPNQILGCFSKTCEIDPIVFKLAKFDNYGDAYIDLSEQDKREEFTTHINHFVSFMQNYPHSNIFLHCGSKNQESEIRKKILKKIEEKNLINYFEYTDVNFERRSPGGIRSGLPYSEYDTYSQTIEQFFKENRFNEPKFYKIPFNKARIDLKEQTDWQTYRLNKKFIKFLQHNPDIILEISGKFPPKVPELLSFIQTNSIKARIFLIQDPENLEIKQAIAHNRQSDLKNLIRGRNYDQATNSAAAPQQNQTFRQSLIQYHPGVLGLTQTQNQNAGIQVGQNQNQNQNQNQSQQLRQSTYVPYEPPKLEITSKSSIPDVNYAANVSILSPVVGLRFNTETSAPQTEANMDHLLTMMGHIIKQSTASLNCYCPLSYSIEELVPGAFYIPRTKLGEIPHPNSNRCKFDVQLDTLFFSPPYASIAVKKDPYAFAPVVRPGSHVTFSNDKASVVSVMKLARDIADEATLDALEPAFPKHITIKYNLTPI